MYFENNGKIYKKEDILEIDINEIENLKINVLIGASYTFRINIEGIDEINFIYRCCPHVLEGKRLKWLKRRWMVHNLIGHPLMQIFAFFKCYNLAMKIHDCTIPKPIGEKEPNLRDCDSFSGKLDIHYGQETEGFQIWQLQRTDIWVTKDNYWERVVTIEDDDYLVIWNEGVIVWKGFIKKDYIYDYGARWWPEGFNKYQRLDWQDFFIDGLNATLYRRKKDEN